jgi:hypothetical protein
LTSWVTVCFSRTLLPGITSGIQKVREMYYYSLFYKNKHTAIFQRNPPASSNICYFGPQTSWCHLRRMFSVAREATYAPRPWPLRRLQIGVHVTHLLAVRKYDNQMGWDLDWKLCGGEARISVLESFERSLLPYEFNSCHDAKQLHLSKFLCIYCEFLASAHFKHSTVHCTNDRLSTILVVSEDGPIKITKQRQRHFAGRRHTWICWSWEMTYIYIPCFDVCLQVHSGALIFHRLSQSVAG